MLQRLAEKCLLICPAEAMGAPGGGPRANPEQMSLDHCLLFTGCSQPPASGHNGVTSDPRSGFLLVLKRSNKDSATMFSAHLPFSSPKD